MIVLVTGASGFIGRHVVSALAANGHRPAVLLRSGSATDGLEAFVADARYGDLRDARALADAVRGVGAVIHLAGLTRAKSEAEFDRVNADGVTAMLRACQGSAPDLEAFVLVSSLAAAGPSGDRPRTEADPPEPVSAYGRSKLRGEQRLTDQAGRIPWTIVRPPIVYGPYDRDLHQVFQAARRGFVPVAGSADRRYATIYGPDLAAALVRVLETPDTRGRSFFAAEAADHSYREIAATIGDAVGRRPRLVTLPPWLARGVAAGGSLLGRLRRRPPVFTLAKLPEVLAPGWSCSSSELDARIGCAGPIDFAAGCRLTAAWYRAAGWLPGSGS